MLIVFPLDYKATVFIYYTCVCVGVLMMHTHTIASISSAVRQTPGWAEIKTLFTFPLENSKIFMQEIKRNCFSFSNLKACYYFF